MNSAIADSWTGDDKTLHFAAAASISAIIAATTGNENTGFWTGVAVGTIKEVYDLNRRNHTASVKDIAWNVVGGYVGAKLGGYIFVTRKDNAKGHTIIGFGTNF